MGLLGRELMDEERILVVVIERETDVGLTGR